MPLRGCDARRTGRARSHFVRAQPRYLRNLGLEGALPDEVGHDAHGAIGGGPCRSGSRDSLTLAARPRRAWRRLADALPAELPRLRPLSEHQAAPGSRRADRHRRYRRGLAARGRPMAVAALADRRDRRPAGRARRRDRSPSTSSSPSPTAPRSAQAAATLVRAGATVDLPPNLADNDDLLAAAFGRNAVTAGFVLTNETDAALPAPKAGFAFAGADPQSLSPHLQRRPLQPAAAERGGDRARLLQLPAEPRRHRPHRAASRPQPRQALSGAVNRGAADGARRKLLRDPRDRARAAKPIPAGRR